MTTDSPKRVFCRDCVHLYDAPISVSAGELGFRNITVEKCKVALVTYDPIRGEIKAPSDPKVLNKHCNCPHHTPHGAERIRPSVAAVAVPKPNDPLKSWLVAVAAALVAVGIAGEIAGVLLDSGRILLSCAVAVLLGGVLIAINFARFR
jgi:hypothetical protein